MENNLLPSGNQVRSAAKNPAAYMLVVSVILLGIFVTLYYTSNNNNRSDCQAEVTRLIAEKAALMNIIVSNNVAFKTIRHNTDSVVRSKLQKQNKVKHNN